ncbi:MAG TPA: serine/threonine-protein kinase [Myxococcaceae bacterium]
MSSTALSPGTQVGTWRVLGFLGRGVYGTVYVVEHAAPEQTGHAALKLAIYSADPRFEREAELLSRIRHPSVPRLLDAGLWRAPAGRAHPFVVMECVEGVPLYAWAARRNPSSRQVLALLAQAAGALQATHEVSSVHRDVKGDNMLVRPSDGRLFLTDFGTGYFAGAERLTPLPLLPSTPAYRSPEMWQYIERAGPDANAPLMARPSDDVFALGVTAYRLVTDTYPPFTNPHTAEGQLWLPGGRGVTPPRQLNPRVDAQLNALILRMLSPRPEERGTAGELAEAMKRGVTHSGPSADTPLFEWETQNPSEWTQEERTQAEELGHRPRRRSKERGREPEMNGRRWLPWLAAAMALGLWPSNTSSLRTEGSPPMLRSGSSTEGDAVSLGDTSLSSSDAPTKAPAKDAVAQELPKQPQPGQLKPDSKGRCLKKQIAINGGCWRKVDLDPDECPGNGFMYQGGCYVPIFTLERQPASAPQQSEH